MRPAIKVGYRNSNWTAQRITSSHRLKQSRAAYRCVHRPRDRLLRTARFVTQHFQSWDAFIFRGIQHATNSKISIILEAFAKLRKGKSVPLQAWSDPEGSRKLSFPDFMTTAQEGGKVVSPTHRPHLPSGNSPGTHFC